MDYARSTPCCLKADDEDRAALTFDCTACEPGRRARLCPANQAALELRSWLALPLVQQLGLQRAVWDAYVGETDSETTLDLLERLTLIEQRVTPPDAPPNQD